MAVAEIAAPKSALLVLVAVACAGPPAPDPTSAYLERLLAGDRGALEAAFTGQPVVDDPMGGRVRGAADFERFVAERHRWLKERQASLESLRTTQDDHHTVSEAILHLRLSDTAIDLPIAVAGDRAPGGRVSALRVYHSHWPLERAHRVRSPLLQPDPSIALQGVIGVYQRALAKGNVDSIVGAFEPDGSFREPSGGVWVHRGTTALRAFMAQILGAGGIGLEHCTLTDDGVVAAIEFNAVRFGSRQVAPQAGLAVYQRSPRGLLQTARIYDDVNVEVLAATP